MLRINQVPMAAAGVVLLHLEGELRVLQGDQLLIEAVRPLARAGFRVVLLDLQGVTEIDAAGLGALASARNLVTEVGGQIVLLNPGRRVAQLLSVTGLLSVFDVIEEDAKEHRARHRRYPTIEGGPSARRATQGQAAVLTAA
jgi:anti-anti-sigma factor